MTFDGPTTPRDPVEGDDRLLDAISRGEPPGDHPADDPLAALLTGWHADVLARSQQLESTLQLPPVGPAVQDPPAPPSTVNAAPSHGAAARPDRSKRIPGVAGLIQKPGWRPRHKAYAGATLALVAITGGVWLAAAHAQPGELMWPVTRLVHADRAEALITEREVGRMLDQARQDLADGQHADARYHLERAAALLDGINDHETAVRLRNDIEQLRQRLPHPTPAAPKSPSAPDGHVATDLPAPSLTAPATAAVTQPAGTDPGSSADTSTQSTPALPAAESRPTNLSRPTPPARPNVPATPPQPQPSAARTSTAENDAHHQAPTARPPRPQHG